MRAAFLARALDHIDNILGSSYWTSLGKTARTSSAAMSASDRKKLDVSVVCIGAIGVLLSLLYWLSYQD